MRVAAYYNNKDVRIEDRPVPVIGKGELLIKIEAAGICGSDVMEWYRASQTPRILGHEVAGEIVEVGEGATDFRKGDRVTATHHVPCNHCHYCRLGHQTLCDTLRQTHFDPGGFSEWVRLPEINVKTGVFKLPDSVSFEEATIVEPLACTVRGQNKVNVRADQTVLVIGSGASGLLHILLAKARGAKRVIASDIVDFRLEAARRLGADEVLRSGQKLPLADVVIVCAGAKEATLQALECVERGGSILFFALQSPEQVIPVAMNDLFWQKGATLTSSYAASPTDLKESLDWISSKKIDVKKLITHRLGLSEVAKGFELVSRATDSIKVILDPSR